MKTAQEVFDTAYKRIVKQGTFCGETSQIGPDMHVDCCYTLKSADMKKTLHCAVGILMNAKEKKEMGNFVGDVFTLNEEDYDKVLRPFFREHEGLLAAIQTAHDDAAMEEVNGKGPFLERFKDRMTVIAKRFELEPPA